MPASVVILDIGDDYFHRSDTGWKWDWFFPVREMVREFDKRISVREFLFWGRLAGSESVSGEAKYDFPSSERIRVIGARTTGARGILSHLVAIPQLLTKGLRALAKADIIFFRWPSLHSMTLFPFAVLLRKTTVVRLRVDVEAALLAAGAIRSHALASALAKYTRWALRRATTPVCISTFLKEKYGNDRTVIVNECAVMDTDVVQNDGPRQPIVLYVGRLTREKGVDVLIRALPFLQNRSFALHIVGGGPERAALESLAGSVAAGRVSFLGPIADRNDLAAIYRRATLFVLPSRSEGLGCVLIEAMAAGVPIVATRVGGIPDLIKDGSNGLLVPPNEPEALAAAIDRMLKDEPLRHSAADQGLNVARQNTFEKNIGLLIDRVTS